MFPIKTSDASRVSALQAEQQSGLACLPQHSVLQIISSLPFSSLGSFASTCRHFALLTKHDSLWEALFCDRFLPGLTKEVVVEKGAFLQACKRQHRIDSNLKIGVCAIHTPLHSQIAPCSLAVGGGRAIAGFAHDIIEIWDLASGARENTLYGHDDYITAVAVEGNVLYSGCMDRKMKVWDLRGGKCLKTLQFDGEVIHFLSTDEKSVFAGFNRNRLRGWDVETFELSIDLTLPGDEVKAFAMDKGRVFLGFADSAIKMMDMKTGESLTTFKAREGAISTLAVGMGRLFVGFDDGMIEILNRRTGQSEVVLNGHERRVTGLVFTEGRLFSSSFDRTIRVWDFGAPDKVILQQLIREMTIRYSSASISAEKRFLRMPKGRRDEEVFAPYTDPPRFEGDLGREEYYHQNWIIAETVNILFPPL